MIRSDLEGLATLMTTNEAEAEVTAMLANSQEVQSFADRFNKQRKVQQAVANAGQPKGASSSVGASTGKGGSPSPAAEASPPPPEAPIGCGLC
eukprot:234108-Pyramimonas_sp.AAC.1